MSDELHQHESGEDAMQYTCATEIARDAGAPPRAISDLFYQGVLDETLCPMVGGRRIIPKSYAPTIMAALRDRGFGC